MVVVEVVVVVVGRVVVVVLDVVVVVEVVVDVVVVVGRVVVVVLDVVVVVGRVVVVDVVVVEVVVVVGRVVVVDVLVVVLEVVVVVVGAVTDTEQPVALVTRIGTLLVSNRFRNASPIGVTVFVVPTTLNVTLAMLTTPVGPVRLMLWKPEIGVEPLANVEESVVGEVWNSGVLPPTTPWFAMFRTVGSYVSVIP